jgi:hypothetical protein
MKNGIVFFGLIIAALVVSCDTMTGGGGTETPTGIICTIEAPLYAFGSDSIDSDLNVGSVTARVNDHQLETTGTIENGILRIGLTAVPDSWLLGAKDALNMLPDIPDSVPDIPPAYVTPNTKVGNLELEFNDEYDFPHIIKIGDTASSETSYVYDYINQKGEMTGKMENLEYEILGIHVIASYDADAHFSKGWNIFAITSFMNMPDATTLIGSNTTRTVSELPETARWYYW